MTRYTFDEVQKALNSHWGLALHRGGTMTMDDKDGRFDRTYSKTGFVINGQLPGRGYGSLRYRSLTHVVESCDLVAVIEKSRQGEKPRRGGAH